MLAFPVSLHRDDGRWMTTELGRQPWLVYGLFRTADGASPSVHSGTALFTLIGFAGLYFVLGLLFLFLDRTRDCSRSGIAGRGRPGTTAGATMETHG